MQNRIRVPQRAALYTLTAALIAAGITANAATVIEMQSRARKSTMTIENDKARLQSEPVNYSLIHPSAGQYMYVSQDKKQVVKMYDSPPTDADAKPFAPPPGVKLVRKGPGPKIAGFRTQQYQLFADGVLCLNTYLSRDAMERGKLKPFHIAFYHMQAKQKQAARNAGAGASPCGDAEELLTARYADLGLAMRTLFPDGQLRQEIVSIKTGVTVANGFFEPPQDLKMISHEEFIKAMSAPQRDMGKEAAKALTEPKQEAAPAEKKDGSN